MIQYLWKVQSEGPSYGEIRLLKLDRPPKRLWCRVGLDLFPDLTDANLHEGYDAYFGVLPRQTMDGTGASIIPSTRVLWADFDRKDGNTESLFSTLTAQPQFVVDSGGGWHAYWVLERAIPLPTAEQIMRGFQVAGADHCWDRARIMRIPETVNHKYGTVARILKADYLTRTRVELFSEYRYVGYEPPARTLRAPSSLPQDKQEIPNWLAERIRQGVPKGQRSEASFGVVCQLIQYGYSFDDIADVFVANRLGIGEKYHERNMGDRWLRLTYENALKSIGTRQSDW